MIVKGLTIGKSTSQAVLAMNLLRRIILGAIKRDEQLIV